MAFVFYVSTFVAPGSSNVCIDFPSRFNLSHQGRVHIATYTSQTTKLDRVRVGGRVVYAAKSQKLDEDALRRMPLMAFSESILLLHHAMV